MENVVLLALAAYAFAYTMANLHGPFGLSERLRMAVPNLWFVKLAPGSWEWLEEGVYCPICWSFWATAIWFPVFGWQVFGSWGLCVVLHLFLHSGKD